MSSLPDDSSSVVSAATASPAASRSSKVVRRSGCSYARTRTRPFSVPIARVARLDNVRAIHAVHHEPVAAHQPHPRRLAVPAAGDRTHRSRD